MNDTNNNPEESTTEKRKGFHPILVISTIVVVLFVLWFCPWAIMRARVTQNEQAALAVLSHPAEIYRLFSMPQQKIAKHLRRGKFKNELKDLMLVAQNYFHAKSTTKQNNYAICLTPKNYGRTADTTFLLISGKIYSKDLGKQYTISTLPTPDKSWKPVAKVK